MSEMQDLSLGAMLRMIREEYEATNSALTAQLEAANAKIREQAMAYLALDQQATEALERAVKAEEEKDRLAERCDAYKGQVEAGAKEIATLEHQRDAFRWGRNLAEDSVRKARDERDAMEEQIKAAREFVKRHPMLTLLDLAEFEAFLKVPAALDAALKTGAPSNE